jgi:plasmid stability protein
MPVVSHRIDNARHWRARAEEARELAEQMANPEAKRIMLGIAVSYVALAKMAGERDAAKRKG